MGTDLRRRVIALALAGLLGYLVLYVYGLATGAFSPGELLGFTAIAVVAAIVFGIHAVRVHRAMERPGDPAHDEIAQAAHEQRERRGF